MTLLYLYAAGVAVLVIVLLLIVGKTAALVRAGGPLLAVGSLRWESSALARQTKPASPRPAESKHRFSNPMRLLGLRRTHNKVAPVTAPEEPVLRERSRKLASFSALAAPESGEADHEAAACDPLIYVAATEARIELSFDQFCTGSLTLDAFAVVLADEEAELIRLRAAATSPALVKAIDEAIAVVAHCSDWVRQQAT